MLWSSAWPTCCIQVGVTPEGVEVPRVLVDPEWQAVVQSQPHEHRATMPSGADKKWRYMWRVGPRPTITKYAELNSQPVVPKVLAQLCCIAF